MEYEGEWQDGVRQGYGVATHANGARYEGSWSDDKMHGKGTYTYIDASRYVGDWQVGKKHGQGTLIYVNGESWSDDKMHGKGSYDYINGDKYEGEWNVTFLQQQQQHTFLKRVKQGHGVLTHANVAAPYETQILVCQEREDTLFCRMRGSEAVLLEIEELARFVDQNCDVIGSGCLGLCSQAPGVVVVKKLRDQQLSTTELRALREACDRLGPVQSMDRLTALLNELGQEVGAGEVRSDLRAVGYNHPSDTVPFDVIRRAHFRFDRPLFQGRSYRTTGTRTR